jgi:hypothetical protein
VVPDSSAVAFQKRRARLDLQHKRRVFPGQATMDDPLRQLHRSLRGQTWVLAFITVLVWILVIHAYTSH